MFKENKGFIDTWRREYKRKIPWYHIKDRVALQSTVGLFNVFLGNNTKYIDTGTYGRVKSENVINNIVSGIDNGQIILHWKLRFEDMDGIKYSVKTNEKLVMAQIDGVLSGHDIKNRKSEQNYGMATQCVIDIYNNRRRVCEFK